MGGHADRERPDLPGQLDEIDGVGEVAGRQVQLGRRVTPQGENVLDPLVAVAAEDGPQLVFEMAGAAQMGHRRHIGRPQDVDDEVVGPLPGRPPGAVGDRDERRLQRSELEERPLELGLGLLRLRGEELEREATALGEQIGDAGHGRSA